MKFTAPSRRCVFTLQLKGKGRPSGFKSGLQLAPNTRDRGRCSLSLPPLSALPFKRSDSHENPQRPAVPVLYPALTACCPPHKHTRTQTSSVSFTPARSPRCLSTTEHHEVKNISERKKKGSHKVHCQNNPKCFEELIEGSWMLVSTVSFKGSMASEGSLKQNSS